jgi:hypothetical protein
MPTKTSVAVVEDDDDEMITDEVMQQLEQIVNERNDVKME